MVLPYRRKYIAAGKPGRIVFTAYWDRLSILPLEASTIRYFGFFRRSDVKREGQ